VLSDDWTQREGWALPPEPSEPRELAASAALPLEIRRYRARRRWPLAVSISLVAVAAATTAAFSGTPTAPADPTAHGKKRPRAEMSLAKPAVLEAKPINTSFRGLTTFRGNASRTYYGEGPVPRTPKVLWRYPDSGGLCSSSRDEHGTTTWCGLGWTGQPNVLVRRGGRIELRFGAFDRRYHFLDGRTGRPIRPELETGDLAKGSATSDPDGFPLYYAGSRDNFLRIVALDRKKPTVLWKLDSRAGLKRLLWNDDWDGAPLVVRGHLLVGGENGWFYAIRLNRRYDERGKVHVNPRVVVKVPGWDGRLLEALEDTQISIESSVAFHRGVAYFGNSGGLVQGWNVADVLAGGRKVRRVFRFWTGDDTDASVVIDRKGYLYVASELERRNARSARMGQLFKLDPSKPRKPVVWSIPIRRRGWEGKGGIWSTPALYGGLLYVATNAGDLLGVDRRTGKIHWRISLHGPTWASPVVVDDVLLQGDCGGALNAFDVSRPRRKPRQLWRVELGGCIEATPAVFGGMIWIGTRGGAIYGIGRASS
jgi:outer membrane protein assembly factor BamB